MQAAAEAAAQHPARSEAGRRRARHRPHHGRQPVRDYFLTPMPADFGRAFKVEKVGLTVNDPPYHVNIDRGKRSCECKGFLRHGHCKHADGLAALIAAGRL
jgi:hypothetical protein